MLPHFAAGFDAVAMPRRGGSSSFLPTQRATDAVRHAVTQMAAAMDRSARRGVQVRCVSFQDPEGTRSLVLHTLGSHRDAVSPVIHVRYKLIAETAVTLGRGAPDPCLVRTKVGALCVVSLSARAQLVLLGVLDANRRSSRFALPASPLDDMDPSYLACAPPASPAALLDLPEAQSFRCIFCADSTAFECTECNKSRSILSPVLPPTFNAKSYATAPKRRHWRFKLKLFRRRPVTAAA